jgi:SARP family transcriptional regulator, regulator of embCAB operon
MRFQLLGPFEARHRGVRVEVAKRRQERCLLAILLLKAGRLVTIDRLADLLWDGRPPASARSAIHTYIGRLRNALQPFDVTIETRGDGYLVRTEGAAVDVHEFNALAQRGIAVRDAAERVQVLEQALDLWRGPLLADVADDRLRHRLEADLRELRLSSMELKAEAQLAMGRPDQVIADLGPVTTPQRERSVALLMTAMHHCGRTADALALYRATRAALVDELGIEPGPDLRARHEQILRNEVPQTRPTPVYAVEVRGHWLPWAVGGHPALEFCNTLAGWGDSALTNGEWLRGYETLAVWAGYHDLADERTVSALIERAHHDPTEAEATLRDARVLRSHLYDALTDVDDEEAFAVVAKYADDAAKYAVFARGSDGLGRWTIPMAAGLRLPVYAVAKAAADLLSDPRRFTVRACRGQRCGWLFLDVNGLRRWCSTSTCGTADHRQTTSSGQAVSPGQTASPGQDQGNCADLEPSSAHFP